MATAELMAEAQRVANFGSWEWRITSDEVSWSPHLYAIFGIEGPQGDVLFRVTYATYLERVHPDERQRVRDNIEEALADTKPFRFQHRIVRPDGTERTLRCQGEPVRSGAAGPITRVIGVCQDVTELAEVEAARAEADARFKSAFDNAPIGIALLDFTEGSDGRLTDVNHALVELTGREPSDLIGSTLSRLCLAEDAVLDQDMRERLMADEIGCYSVEKRALHGDDRLIWLGLIVSTVPDEGSVRRAGIVQVQDVTERKRFEEQLRHVADHDSLTGLANRRRFHDELESYLALQRRYGGHGALLLIDLDRLKAVNDTRGHGAGDIALKRVADAMRGRVRSTDVIARLAGDEFAILLPNTETHEAVTIGNSLIDRLARDEVAAWGVSISVGVAPLGEGDTRATEEVMATADAAMYRAKQRGGGVTHTADHPAEQMPYTRTGRGLSSDPGIRAAPLPVAERVRHALEADELLVYGQPILDLQTGAVAHRELLVRMRDGASGQVVSASRFLAAASREPGLCSSIDCWVVDRALALLASGESETNLQVNLAGETLTDTAVIEGMIGRIEQSGIDRGALGFEVSEGTITHGYEATDRGLEMIAGAGCPLALDGFSAGAETFGYIQRLPVRQIKIDPSVIRGFAGDDPDLATLRAIVRLARGTSKTTVAKVVSAPGVMPLLREHGIDMAQGNELGEPAPLAA